MFDLSEFDLQAEAERGATMTLLNPKTGDRTDATCQVIGTDSKSYRANVRKLRDAAIKADNEPTDEDDAMLLNRARNAAAALTGWDGVTNGGEPVKFSTEAVIDLGTRFPWFADQVLAFANSRGNFGKG